MSFTKIIIITCIVAFIALIISIIKTNSFLGIKNPNNKLFIKDNLIFRANLNIKGDRNYRVLDIGTVENPFYETRPRFKFKINDNPIFKSDQIDIDELRKICDSITDPNEFEKRWPDDAELINCKGYVFLVSNDLVLNFYAQLVGDNIEVPEIGDINTNKLYPFPLSQDQIIQIFGEPDKIEEYFSW